MFLCPCLEVRYKFRMQTTFGSSLPSVDCMTGRFLIDDICACLRIIVSSTCWQNEPHGGHHLRAHGLIPGFGEVRISNVYFILCVLFVFILYDVCLMLPVSLDCPFLITTSGFSNVYLRGACRHHVIIQP
jgi:hypothetical protein